MAIWIGEAGGIRIGRSRTERQYNYIAPSGVDAGNKRFGFQDPTGLITGDRVWFRRVDENGEPTTEPLDFVAPEGWVDGVQRNDGQWFISKDSVGGMRLYRLWEEAVAGRAANAISVVPPSSTYRCSYELVRDADDCLAQTISWTLNTDREVADYTSLGDGFRQQMGTLVSGSGELDCFFSAASPDSDPTAEPSLYLHKLALRQQVGAQFTGVFLLKQTNAMPLDAVLDKSEALKELFYTADCVITAVATELAADQPIHSKITFVTTGPIELLFDYPSDYLLQEQLPNDRILQESDFGILLEVPS